MVLVSAPLIATYSAAFHNAWSGIVSFQSSSVRSSDIQRALGLKSDHRLPASLLTHTHTQHASMWMMMATTTTALHLWQVHFFSQVRTFFCKSAFFRCMRSTVRSEHGQNAQGRSAFQWGSLR